MMSVQSDIQSLARRLRLPAIADYREYLAEDPEPLFLEGLLQLLQAELAGREERGFARRLKESRLSMLKTLDVFERHRLPHLPSTQIDELLPVHSSGTTTTSLLWAIPARARRTWAWPWASKPYDRVFRCASPASCPFWIS
jgi:hypothetical protein